MVEVKKGHLQGTQDVYQSDFRVVLKVDVLTS